MGMIPKSFPAFPDRDDVSLAAKLVPAKEVGGDLYDFFIDDEKLYFIIGDVSGKGCTYYIPDAWRLCRGEAPGR